jgi:hypothetical protein
MFQMANWALLSSWAFPVATQAHHETSSLAIFCMEQRLSSLPVRAGSLSPMAHGRKWREQLGLSWRQRVAPRTVWLIFSQIR